MNNSKELVALQKQVRSSKACAYAEIHKMMVEEMKNTKTVFKEEIQCNYWNWGKYWKYKKNI